MTIQDLGALGEIIGAIAVVASLIYLAIQIRQNTQQMLNNAEATKLAALESNIESSHRIREMLILNPDLTRLFLSGIKSYDGLEAADRFRFDLLLRNTMTAFQGAYLRHLSIGGDPLDFQGTGRLIESILDNPGTRTWLERSEFDWRPEFRQFIKERLSNLDDRVGEPAASNQTAAR